MMEWVETAGNGCAKRALLTCVNELKYRYTAAAGDLKRDLQSHIARLLNDETSSLSAPELLLFRDGEKAPNQLQQDPYTSNSPRLVP